MTLWVLPRNAAFPETDAKTESARLLFGVAGLLAIV
jgi:hypothetical protein